MIGNKKWYIKEFDGYNRMPTVNMDDGLYFYFIQSNEQALAYKYPAKVNDSYYHDPYGDSITVLSIVDSRTSCT